MMDTSIPVWKDGKVVETVDHKAASGTPPIVAEDREPVLDQWEVDEEYYHSTPHVAIGREMRWHKGPGKAALRKEYRAYAEIGVMGYPGNERRYSKTFESYDQADVQKVNAWGSTNPMQAQHEQEISAAVARSHRRHDQAAPSDIRRIAQEMASDLLLAYHPWKVKYDRHIARLQATAELRNQIATMAEDIQEHGRCGEYETFITQLSSLLVVSEREPK